MNPWSQQHEFPSVENRDGWGSLIPSVTAICASAQGQTVFKIAP